MDQAFSIKATNDDGYVIAGRSQSFRVGCIDYNVYIIKINSNGVLQWSRTYGDGLNSVDDEGFDVSAAIDGGYVITGYSTSFGDADIYLIKTDSIGKTGCCDNNPSTITGSIPISVHSLYFPTDTNALISSQAIIGNVYNDTTTIACSGNTTFLTSMSSTNDIVTCFSDDNGTATINVSGGTPPYSFLWISEDTIGSTQTITGLNNGFYTCKVVDSNGIEANNYTLIYSYGQWLDGPYFSQIQKPCTGENNGSAMFRYTVPGTPPYTYLWNTTPPQTTATATGLEAGTYHCSITDAIGCTAEADFTLENAEIIFDASSIPTSCNTCADGQAIINNASGGHSPYTYSWDSGNCISSNCTGLLPGTYICCVQDANGCEKCDSVVVGVSTTGIHDLNNSIGINIYPNPATNEITIQNYTPDYIKLCNTLGQNIAEANKSNKLWLGNLPQGLYFLQLFDEKGILVKAEKIVKE
jgi:hypothetical protein